MAISPISNSYYQNSVTAEKNHTKSYSPVSDKSSLAFKSSHKIVDTFVKNPQVVPTAIAAVGGVLAANSLVQASQKVEGYEKLTYSKEYWNGYDTNVVRYANGKLKLRTAKNGTKLQEATKDGILIYNTESWGAYTAQTIITYQNDGTPIERRLSSDRSLLQKWDKNGVLIYDKRAKDPHNPPEIFSRQYRGKCKKNAPGSFGMMTLEERMAKEKEWREREKLYERKPSAAEIKYKEDLKKYNEGSRLENLGKTKPKPSDYGLVATFYDTPISE